MFGFPWVICDPWYDDYDPIDFDDIISAGSIEVIDLGDGTISLTPVVPDVGLAGCETLTWTITGSMDTTVVSSGDDPIIIEHPGPSYSLDINVDVLIEGSNYVSNFGDTVSGCPDPPILTITNEVCDTTNNTLTYEFTIEGCLPSYQLAVETDNGQGAPVLSSDVASTDFSVTFTDTMEVGTTATVYVLDDAGNLLTEFPFEPDADCIKPICIADAGDLDEQKIFIRTITNPVVPGTINGFNHWMVLTDMTGNIRATDPTGVGNLTPIPNTPDDYKIYSYIEVTPLGTTFPTTFPTSVNINDILLPLPPPSIDVCYEVVEKEICFMECETQNVKCKGGNDGRIEILENCGGSYLYLWNNGSTNQTQENLPAGEYSVTVTDDVGNTASASITIEEPDTELFVDGSIVSYPTCETCNEGVIEVVAEGGVPPYTYILDGPVFEEGELIVPGSTQLDSLLSGYYTLTVTDSAGCQIIEDIALGTVGIDEQPNLLDEFTLMPNPANEQVTVAYRVNQIGEPASIALYDYAGKLLYRQGALPPTGTLQIATNDYPNGSYFVVIEQNGNRATKPLAIVR